MGKKVVGLSFGRHMSNTEILIKEALIACEEAGCEIEFINCEKLNIKPCRGCCKCVGQLASCTGNGACFQDDDFHIIEEAIWSSDAVIFGAPVYCVSPSGQFKNVVDRIGPAHDITFVMPAIEAGEKEGRDPSTYPDKRALKPRIGALISVGGAMTENWTAFGLPIMQEAAMSMNTQVIDEYNFYGAMEYNSCIGRPDAIARAKKMGENIVAGLAELEEKGDVENLTWRGDSQGACPVCHQKVITVTGDGNKIECPVCGIYGTLEIEDGKIKTIFPASEIKRSRMKMDGKWEHSNEIRHGAMTQKQVEDLAEKKKRYTNVGKK